MRDALIVLLSFAAVIGLFCLRVKQVGGWRLLPRSKTQSLFGHDDKGDKSE